MSSSHRNRGSGAISSEGNNNASAVAAAAAASSNATSLRIERATSPEAIRKLVLDYLLHHCYIDTAQAFAKDGDPLEAGSFGVTGETTPAASTSRTGSQLQLGAASSASATPRRQAHPLAAPPWSGHDAMSSKDDGLARSQESAPESLARSIDFSRKSTAANDEDEEMKGDDTEVKAGDDDDDDEEEEDIHALTTPRFKKRPVVGGDTSDDMHTVTLRREIRDEIMAGRIRRATELLNTNFPQVLNADGALEATAGGPSSSPDGRSGTKLKRPATTTKASIPSGPTSLDPRHLTLNLQIQSFIENVRIANSPLSQSNGSGGNGGNGIGVGNGTPTPASPAPHSLGINPATAASISRASSPAPSSASSASSSASGPSTGVHGALQSALANAQGLYASVQALKSGPYKDLYKRELENVTALLAYKDLERSPLRKYLDVKRRRSLAEQINSAIMFRSGRPAQPLLESAVRQTTFVWSQLHNDQVPIPAQHPVYLDSSSSGHFRDASGLGLGDPPWGSIGKEGLSGGLFTTTDADGKGKGKVPEAFHLPTFLSDR